MNWTNENLNELRSRLDEYLSSNQLSQSAFSKKVDVPEAIISLIRKGEFEKTNKNKSRLISDKSIQRVMNFFATENKVWQTSQYKDSFKLLSNAKLFKIQGILDGPRGSGKSHALEDFQRQLPHETFVITCAQDMGVRDFIEEWARVIGVELSGSRYKIRRRIVEALLKMKNPVCFFDEMEEVKSKNIYGAIKAVYDDKHLYRQVGMVLVGANNYLEQLQSLCDRKNAHSFPQMISRFASNHTLLNAMNKQDCKFVLNTYYDIIDKDLITEFYNDSDNDYRRLERKLSDHFNKLNLLNDTSKAA